MPIFHFTLNLEVFCEIQKQMERHKKYLLLFLDDLCQLLLVLPEFSLSLLVLLHVLYIFQIFVFLLELFNPDHVSFDFVVDDFDGRVADLVCEKELVELGEV